MDFHTLEARSEDFGDRWCRPGTKLQFKVLKAQIKLHRQLSLPILGQHPRRFNCREPRGFSWLTGHHKVGDSNLRGCHQEFMPKAFVSFHLQLLEAPSAFDFLRPCPSGVSQGPPMLKQPKLINTWVQGVIHHIIS